MYSYTLSPLEVVIYSARQFVASYLHFFKYFAYLKVQSKRSKANVSITIVFSMKHDSLIPSELSKYIKLGNNVILILKKNTNKKLHRTVEHLKTQQQRPVLITE